MKRLLTPTKLVILIIIVIGIVVFYVTDTINNIKKEDYNEQIHIINAAAKIWGAQHADLLPVNEGEAISIPVLLLKQSGLLDVDFTNTLTQEKFYDNMYIDIVLDENGYTYSPVEDSGNTTYDIGVTPIILKEKFNYDKFHSLSLCEVIVLKNGVVDSTVPFLNVIYNLDRTLATISYTYNDKTFRVERKAKNII